MDPDTSYDDLNREQVAKNLRSNLPEELRRLKSFLLFKYTPSQSPGGKRGKVPYYVHTRQPRHGTQGEPDDLAHMSTFTDALRLYRTTQDYAGLGIAALPQNNLTFIDVDHCLDDAGHPNSIAQELLDWHTYAEVSPSGHGLRMVVNGDLGLDQKNLDDGIEAFSHKGFVTITGYTYGTLQPVRTLTPAQTARLRTLLHAETTTAATATPDDQRSIPSPLQPQLDKVKAALKKIDPDLPYNDWIMVGQALHSGDPDPQGNGFKLWFNWSRRGSKFNRTSLEDMLQKWRGFKPGKGITIASLIHLAKSYGYAIGRKQPHVSLYSNDLIVEPSDPELQRLCPGLFDHIGAYMFVGRAKIGKSRIIGLLTAAALTGTKALGYAFSKRCKVLVLTLEEDAFVHKDRLQTYLVDPVDFVRQLTLVDRGKFRENAQLYSKDMTYIEWMDSILAQLQPDLTFIDPLVNMRMVWRNATEKQSDRITEQDYQLAEEVQSLAERHNTVIVFSMHGSKRKHGFSTGDFDPFEMVGTTSWTAAACSGSFVLLDKPGFKPLEDEDDGQRIFSIRTRYQTQGDVHLVLQYGKHSTITSLGPYAHVRMTARQAEMLEVIQDFAEEQGENTWVTARQIAAEVGCGRRNVWTTLERWIASNQLFNGRRLVSSRSLGYRLQQPAS